jgi:hypothetical protein
MQTVLEIGELMYFDLVHKNFTYVCGRRSDGTSIASEKSMTDDQVARLKVAWKYLVEEG